jgi:hypothetical protein
MCIAFVKDPDAIAFAITKMQFMRSDSKQLAELGRQKCGHAVTKPHRYFAKLANPRGTSAVGVMLDRAACQQAG